MKTIYLLKGLLVFCSTFCIFSTLDAIIHRRADVLIAVIATACVVTATYMVMDCED